METFLRNWQRETINIIQKLYEEEPLSILFLKKFDNEEVPFLNLLQNDRMRILAEQERLKNFYKYPDHTYYRHPKTIKFLQDNKIFKELTKNTKSLDRYLKTPNHSSYNLQMKPKLIKKNFDITVGYLAKINKLNLEKISKEIDEILANPESTYKSSRNEFSTLFEKKPSIEFLPIKISSRNNFQNKYTIQIDNFNDQTATLQIIRTGNNPRMIPLKLNTHTKYARILIALLYEAQSADGSINKSIGEMGSTIKLLFPEDKTKQYLADSFRKSWKQFLDKKLLDSKMKDLLTQVFTGNRNTVSFHKSI